MTRMQVSYMFPMAAGAPRFQAEAAEFVKIMNDHAGRSRRAHAADIARSDAELEALLAHTRALSRAPKTKRKTLSAKQVWEMWNESHSQAEAAR